MNRTSIIKLVAAVVACELIGASGSIFTAPSIPTWYATLTRPPLAPPNWIFAPVWTLLFLLMGVAVWMIWEKGLKRREVRAAIGLFVGQFVLNVLWSVLFFGLHRPGVAFVEIPILWCTILATLLSFRPISKPASWLLAPYLAWVTFAAYLNFMFWWLN